MKAFVHQESEAKKTELKCMLQTAASQDLYH